MVKHRWSIGSLALVLTALVPAVCRAQRISVEWQNVPLSRIIAAFAGFSGRRIVVADDIGDPIVSGAAQNADWERAFDGILADLELITRVDPSGVIRVERSGSRSLALMTVAWQDAPLTRVIEALA